MRKLVGNDTSVVPRNWSRTVCPLQAARLNARCVYELVLVIALRLLKLPSVPSNAPDVLRTSTKTKSNAVDRDSLVVMLSQKVRFAGWPAGMRHGLELGAAGVVRGAEDAVAGAGVVVTPGRPEGGSRERPRRGGAFEAAVDDQLAATAVALLTVTLTTALEPTFPAASNALVWSPWLPFVAVVVFQAIWYGDVVSEPVSDAVHVELDAADADVVARRWPRR